MRRDPSKLRRAIRVPVAASKPACTIAELAFEVPQQTSSSASSTHALRRRRESSRAIAHPQTPAPMTMTS